MTSSNILTTLTIRAIRFDNGCDLYRDCFSCPLPKCFLEESLPIQLKKLDTGEYNDGLNTTLLLKLYKDSQFDKIKQYLTNHVNLTKVNKEERFTTPSL